MKDEQKEKIKEKIGKITRIGVIILTVCLCLALIVWGGWYEQKTNHLSKQTCSDKGLRYDSKAEEGGDLVQCHTTTPDGKVVRYEFVVKK